MTVFHQDSTAGVKRLQFRGYLPRGLAASALLTEEKSANDVRNLTTLRPPGCEEAQKLITWEVTWGETGEPSIWLEQRPQTYDSS